MNLLHGIVLPLVILNFLALTSVHGGCVNRSENDEVNSENKDTESGVSEFFTNLKCDITTGAKKVKGQIEDGYVYIKKKITSHTSEEENDKRRENPDTNNDQAIVFNDDDKKVIPLAPWPDQPTQPTVLSNSSTTQTIDTRVAISAPKICSKQNQKVDQNGDCQDVLDF